MTMQNYKKILYTNYVIQHIKRSIRQISSDYGMPAEQTAQWFLCFGKALKR